MPFLFTKEKVLAAARTVGLKALGFFTLRTEPLIMNEQEPTRTVKRLATKPPKPEFS